MVYLFLFNFQTLNPVLLVQMHPFYGLNNMRTDFRGSCMLDDTALTGDKDDTSTVLYRYDHTAAWTSILIFFLILIVFAVLDT